MTDDRLGAELRALGAALDVPQIDQDATATAVMNRIATEAVVDPRPAVPASSWPSTLAAALRRRSRVVAAALAAVLVAAALTPPVRAAVTEWLGLGGVDVRPGPAVPSAPPPPAVEGGLDLDAAARLVRFEPAVPAVLGDPDAAAVDLDGQMLSMSWFTGTGPVRIDQFAGSLVTKFVRDPGTQVDVGPVDGLWFAEPHDLRLYDAQGAVRPDHARAAGPTLVWTVGETTLRLEGVADRERAVQIARSSLKP